MRGSESESFALFPDYIARFKAADRNNAAYISTISNGTFEPLSFCPSGLRNAGTYLRGFIAIDGTHTKSR
jgi:hypothetical protein